MIWKASLVLSLALCVLSDRRPAVSEQKVERFYTGHHGDLSHIGHREPEHHEVYAWAYPSYEFSYYVDDPHTHDKKGQHEIRDGDKVTGNYWLIQPDGRKRTVNYHSDHKSGFHAEVNYLPHDGYHPDVKEHHGKHGFIEEYKEVRRDGGNGNENSDERRGEELRDERRGEVRRDERRGEERRGERRDDDRRDERRGEDRRGERRDDDGRNERRDEWDLGHKHRWELDYRRNEGKDERRDDGWDEKRSGDDKHGREENRGYEGRLWRIPDWGKERNDHKDDRREHWKHGVLVGWKEGEGRDNRRGDDGRRGRDNDRGREDRRGQHSYHAPIMNFKPLVPYGHRLH